MIQVKTLVLDKEKALFLTKLAVLLVTAVALPIVFSHSQAITGPLVNAVLFISAVILGIEGAVLVALVPSLVALSAGLLPAVMAPMVPFIMTGNVILIFVFDYFRKSNYWLGVVLASFLKFVFLYATSYIVIDLVIKKEVAVKAATMLSWPQLLTALAGGAIAYFILKMTKKLS